MKTRGNHKITAGLHIPNPGGLGPLLGRYAFTDDEGNFFWGNLRIPTLVVGTLYPDKGTFVLHEEKIYYSIIEGATGEAELDEEFWKVIGASDDIWKLPQDQIDALANSKLPTAANPYITKADLTSAIEELSSEDLSGIPAFDSADTALSEIGQYNYFRWTEANIDGVASPNSTTVGLTQAASTSTDVRYNHAIATIAAGASPDWTPTKKQARLAREENTGILWYFNTLGSWSKIDLDNISEFTRSSRDHIVVSEFDDINIAPSFEEIPQEKLDEFDTASKYLSGGSLERWIYIEGSWTLLYRQESVISDVEQSNSIELSIKGKKLSAALLLAASQDPEFELVITEEGVKVKRLTLNAYDSHSSAAEELTVGGAYVLTKNNLNGIPSDGVSSPVFRVSE